jgi:hypothetical protein
MCAKRCIRAHAAHGDALQAITSPRAAFRMPAMASKSESETSVDCVLVPNNALLSATLGSGDDDAWCCGRNGAVRRAPTLPVLLSSSSAPRCSGGCAADTTGALACRGAATPSTSTALSHRAWVPCQTIDEKRKRNPFCMNCCWNSQLAGNLSTNTANPYRSLTGLAGC